MLGRAKAALAAVLGLASCHHAADAPEPGARPLACALAGAQTLKPVCTVRAIDEGARRVLVVRRPDGGFRRFAVTPDGHGLLAADGAEAATVQPAGNQLDVAIGNDRYRFDDPATILPVPPNPAGSDHAPAS